MQEPQVHKPLKVNLDKSKKYLSPEEAFYMLNRERNINGTGTLGKTTPLVANYLPCVIEQPLGDSYTVGEHYSVLTNELYWWVYNSNGVNYIARINGEGECQVVYDGPCLPLSAAPGHAIKQWRCYLKYDKYCAHQHGKQLIWTDGINDIGMLDVEASIATQSFTTAFFDLCPDDCAPIQMCVPEICGALEGEFIPLPADEVDLTNHIVDIGIKVMFRHIYYDGRANEWSDYSSLYFQDSRGCFDSSEGFPRCMRFRIPVGNPLVDKIEFAVSTDNGLTWKSVDVIEKYKPYDSSSQYWYERELSDLPNFSLVDCSFDYIFCNDKQCNPIDPLETSRVTNPVPRQPQGIIRIKDNLGFYNYVKGNCPLDGAQTKKFEISLDCPTVNVCNEELSEITVYAIVHNRQRNLNGIIYRLGGAGVDDPDDNTDKAIFGHPFANTPDGYGQYFRKKTRNFIAYIDATNYYAEMKQFKSEPFFVNTEEVGVVSGMADLFNSLQVSSEIQNGNFYYQQYKFRVPKGTKGFIRLASHKTTNGLPSQGQDTSTYVVGTIPDITAYRGDSSISGLLTQKEELYFDTCSGDVEIKETLIIDDNFKQFETGAHTSSAYAGYISDSNNKRVEGAEIWYDGSRRAITDHNGFYHFYMYGDSNNQTIEVTVRVETGCTGGFNNVKNVTLEGSYGTLVENNIQITDTDFAAYKTNWYETVNVPVTDCNNQPVGGIRVALSGSKYQVTDGVTGIATFRLRNYSTRNRFARAVIMDNNNCFSLDCLNQCNPCLPSSNDTALASCFNGTPSISLPPTSKINKDAADINKKGLKAGGRYGWAIVAKGDCGRLSAAYPATILNASLESLDNYMNIPKTQEKGYLNFCNLTYRAIGMVLPDWVTCLYVARSANVNNYELQWIVDDFERTIDGKIKLTIQSLNDYNATYNFQTNTIYQYQKDDRVEFISNGDGDIFDIATYGLLNYQILSPYNDTIVNGEQQNTTNIFNQIIIDDDGKLDNLEKGAKIELQRPRDCTTEPEYFAVLSLPVIDISGQKVLANPTGTFQSFDTFIVNRQIGANPPQRFEHKFPSDFWGNANGDGIFTGLSDAGRVYFTNKYENESRFGRNITINRKTQFNRFGDLEKTIDAPEQGDITAMGIYDGKVVLAIGEYDNALLQVSDEFLRVGSAGVLQAAAAGSIVSDTQPKISGMYGCRYQSIGSIYFGDGWVTWIDVGKSAHVKHDFANARDMSEGKYNTWIKKVVQYVENFNRTAVNDTEKKRFCTGYNFHTNALQLTVKGLNEDGINNDLEPYLSMKSTLLIEPRAEELLTFASYTQEGYSNINLFNANGCAFVSFYRGQIYIHPILPLKYNEFNGVAVDSVVGISINKEPLKIKRFQAMEIQDEVRWFVTDVRVDNPTYKSMIPPVRFKKTENKWNAEFLCNINGRGGLYGIDKRVAGEGPRGYYCAVTLVRDNTQNLAYNTIDNAKKIIFDELDLVISKFMFSEQSGFLNNL